MVLSKVLPQFVYLIENPYLMKSIFGFTTLPLILLYFSHLQINKNPGDSSTSKSQFEQTAVQALSGTYTIGGDAPDFPNILAAVEALNTQGVDGPVVLNIRDGQYPESVSLTEIAGASAQNSITFQSESQDSSSVIWSNDPSSRLNYIIILDGADWITFRQIKFEASRGVIFYANGANDNEVKNCWSVTSSTSWSQIYLDDTNPPNNRNSFIDNLFEGGGRAIRADGRLSTYVQQISIRQNQFIGQSDYAVGLFQNAGFTIDRNVIISNGGSNIGIYISDAEGFEDGSLSLVSNNFIYLGGRSNAYGIYGDDAEETGFYHNSVHIANTSQNSSACNIRFSQTARILNNIFYNSGGGYSVIYTGSLAASDHNLIYSEGPFLGFNNATFSTLEAWQHATQVDANSISLNPFFTDENSYLTYSIELDDAGIVIPEVAEDIEGRQRNPNTPSIGALEIQPLNVDAGIVEITGPNAPFPAEEQAVYAKFKNQGLNALNSLQIIWQIGEEPVQKVTWTGNLMSGDSAEILLGNVTFDIKTAYSFKAWSTNPGGQADINPVNDTLVSGPYYAGLGGDYTLGSENADFVSFNEAVSTLNNGGVVDSVRFFVQAGSYQEAITMKAILGASADKRIIFNHDFSSDEPVILESSGRNLAVDLDGADWITFRGIQFLAPRNVIRFNDGADNIIIEQCQIANTSTFYDLVYYTSSSNNNNIFRNNVFLNGRNALDLEAGFSSNARGMIVRNNVFQNQSNFPIYCEYLSDYFIEDNVFMSSQSSGSAIYLDDCFAPAMIRNNRIENATFRYGVFLSDTDGREGAYTNIINNFVQLPGAQNSSGMFIFSSDHVNLLHNTVRMMPQNAGSNATAFSVSSSSELIVKNNVWSNRAGGDLIIFNTSIENNQFDFNLYDPVDNDFINFNQEKLELDTWKLTSGLDLHSVAADPYFLSDTSYHYIQYLVDNIGPYLNEAAVDIEGSPRDTSGVDPGVVEFDLKAIDAGLIGIRTPEQPFPAGNQRVAAVIQNFGKTPLTSTRLNWTFNGQTQTTINWQGNLATGDTAVIELGTPLFEVIDTNYIKAWTSLPNGSADLVAVNDTLQSDPIFAALGGTYTLGGSEPDFESFVQASSTLNNGGVVDEVVINVRPGDYTESFFLTEIQGTSEQNQILFQSENGDSTSVNLSPSNDTLIVNLVGADWLTFKSMTFTSPRNTFRFFNHSDHNMITSCHLIGFEPNWYVIYNDENTVNAYNSFVGNTFENGRSALYLRGTTDELGSGIIIMNNRLVNQTVSGIYMEYHEDYRIENNVIETNISTSRFDGIQTFYCSGEGLISNNRLTGLQNGFGLFMDQINYAQTGSLLISNNFIHITGTERRDGIYINNSRDIKVFHNSIHIANTEVQSSGIYVSSDVNNIQVINNVLSNSGGGLVYILNFGTFESDYNLIHTNGPDLAFYRPFNSFEYLQTLEQLQGKNLGLNSFTFEPNFVSDTDLHILSDQVDKTGTSLPEVTTDIDGDKRDLRNPDVGADEVLSKDYDAALLSISEPANPVPRGNQAVSVTLYNAGKESLNNVNINWTVNEANLQTYRWQGNLASGDSIGPVQIGSVNFGLDATYGIKAWTSSPNGQTDEFSANDTAQVNDLLVGMEGVYTIGGTSPDFSTIDEATKELERRGVAGEVIFNIREANYNQRLELSFVRGNSKERPITFQAEDGDSSKVIISSNSGLSAFNVRDISHIYFKQLTFQNDGSGPNVALSGNIDFALFENCAFFSQSLSGNLLNITAIKNDSRIDILNSLFTGGSTGFRGAHSTLDEDKANIKIINSRFINQGLGAINLSGNFQSEIINNHIESDDTFYGNGVSISGSQYPFRIGNNFIGTLEDGQGIYLNNCDGQAAEPSLIYNNFVHLGSPGSDYGIYSQNGSYQHFYFNTVRIDGSTNTRSAAMTIFNGSNKILLNNNLSNQSDGYSMYVLGDPLDKSDFNNFFTTGDFLIQTNSGNLSDLSSWQNLINDEQNSLSVDPLFREAADFHLEQIRLDGKGTPITFITTDLDGETRNPQAPDIGADEFKIVPFDLEVVEITAPVTNCDLSKEEVRVLLLNYFEEDLSGFDIQYSANGDGPFRENVGDFSVPAGDTATYTFRRKLDATQAGPYEIEVEVLLPNDVRPENDRAYYSFESIMRPLEPGSMIPADGTTDLDTRIEFSWSSSGEDVVYDLYFWADTLERSTTPRVSGIRSITYTTGSFNSIFDFSTTYNWQVVARNDYCQTEGPVQSFTLRDLPDLIVTEITAPDIVFSEQDITLDFTVKNQGIGNTSPNSDWDDVVYYSATPDDRRSWQFIRSFPNQRALEPGGSYRTPNVEFTIPQGLQGIYYFIVETNLPSFFDEPESNRDNNVLVSGPVSVRLTPPPDLQVTSIIAPRTVFSETMAEVTYTITNLGDGPTTESAWTDQMYLSKDRQLDFFGDFRLPTPPRNGILLKDSSYTVTDSILIPKEISGTYYLIVQTDRFNSVFEYLSENNNIRVSDSITVFLTPPSDLVVQNISIPVQASNGELITVEWEVKNQGAAATKGTWYDRLYLSKTPGATSGTPLGSFYRLRDLPRDGSYVNRQEVRVPSDLNGLYYVNVHTDAYEDIFEFERDDNNINSSRNTLNILSPDLRIINAQTPGQASSGERIQLNWTLENNGAGSLLNRNVWDIVYLSDDPNFNSNSIIRTWTLSGLENLSSAEQVQRSIDLDLPENISGNYYWFIKTDFSGQIFETNEDNNQYTTGLPLSVMLSPWPDLQVSKISVPEDSKAGDPISFEYTVVNNGIGGISQKSWSDRVYVVPDSNAQSRGILLKTETVFSQNLSPGSTYTRSLNVNLPRSLLSGEYFIRVISDAGSVIFENTDEDNNSAESGLFRVEGFPPVDLVVTQAKAPSSVLSGQALEVSWQVFNRGLNRTNASSWLDAIYLSQDTIWDDDDTQLGISSIDLSLGGGGSYFRRLSVPIPLERAGSFYLLVVADRDMDNSDSDFKNNVRVVETVDANGEPSVDGNTIIVTPAPTSDLVVTDFQISESIVVAGQPVTLTWTVKNQGDTITRKNFWSDNIYLSTTTSSTGARFLESLNFSRPLPVDSSYTLSMEIVIPNDISGNRILVIKTDGSNREFERDAENNNEGYQNITILRPAPTDLVVTNIRVPQMVMLGEQLTVDWVVTNLGVDPAEGRMREAVFLSLDTIWDVSDILLGTVDQFIDLGPGEAVEHTITKDIQALSVDDYYLIVRTDILNNIFESIDNNNTSYSSNTIRMEVPLLAFNEVQPDTLVNNMPLYYRLEVPDSLVGESVLISMKGNAQTGRNELYLRYGAIPTRNTFDFSHAEPFQNEQEILVAELQAGNYYLLVYGVNTVDDRQPVELLAEILQFEIRSVDAGQGGNTGMVTVRVEGGKFQPDMRVYLDNGDEVIRMEKLQYVNPSEVFVTFDLEGESTGAYDVIVELADGQQTELLKGFEIVAGIPDNLYVNILHPEAARPNRNVQLLIEYENGGNTDILNPSAMLRSLAGAPIGLSQQELEQALTELDLALLEEGGPEDRLRPGVGGRILIFTKSTNILGFILDLNN